jgi:hypothetical protein
MYRPSDTILAILFRPFGLLARKTFKIIWLSNLSILSVPDEGYSRNALCALKLPQSIAMVNIHDLADKKVSLSFNVFVFFFFFIAVKPNWHHQTFP